MEEENICSRIEQIVTPSQHWIGGYIVCRRRIVGKGSFVGQNFMANVSLSLEQGVACQD